MIRVPAFLATLTILVSILLSGCADRAKVNHSFKKGLFTKELAGFNIQLVAIAESGGPNQTRVADRAWRPEGVPYDGPEARLSRSQFSTAPGDQVNKLLFFELNRVGITSSKSSSRSESGTEKSPLGDSCDVFAYLPESHGPWNEVENPEAAPPITVQTWSAPPRDSGGRPILAEPSLVGMALGQQDDRPQPVKFGIAKGDFKVMASGTVSIANLNEGQSSTIGQGTWGRIEVRKEKRPLAESKPSPTHRFQLIGGQFPPRLERQVKFYNANGAVVASCGDGPNNPGYYRLGFMNHAGPKDIVRFELQERPYQFVQFDDVCFKAPRLEAHRGSEGLARVIGSSVGQAIGILRPTKEGSWNGAVLYAADGIRWIDPGSELESLEYGGFDPWNQPLDERWNILFEPNMEILSPGVPTTCEIYAADSSFGPTREKLTAWNETPFRSPLTMITCAPTSREFLRLEVRVGTGEWRTMESIPITPAMHESAVRAAPGTRVLEVFFDDDGTIWLWRGEPEPIRSKSTYSRTEQSIRAIARLKSGATREVNFNISGTSIVRIGGNSSRQVRQYRGIEVDRQASGTFVQLGSSNLKLAEIESIDLQAQDFKPAETMSIHSPRK